MSIKLLPHQAEAIGKMKSGSILNGGVGSGKTITSLVFVSEQYSDRDIHVITTAKKRDTGDWTNEAEMVGVKLSSVDSWNSITNYEDIEGQFFIFDEQRAVGYSTWGKTFIKIAKKNNWVMLTATPGDVWMDYLTSFIANGFYKNKTDFVNQHVEYDPWVRYPKIKQYHNQGKLEKHRRDILVPMTYERHTTRKYSDINSAYDEEQFEDTIKKKRWNPYENKPISNVSELLSCLRRTTSESADRQLNAKIIMDIQPRLIVFYNFDYELDILRNIAEDLEKPYAEWNGHRHEEIPDTEEWIYLVQYTSGSEGWNCTTTNTMMFYSMNYSYRMMEQAEGRIDRLNTPFDTLEYYTLTSDSPLDKSISRTLKNKENFNESAWVRKEV